MFNRKEYNQKWAKNNPEKVKEIQKRYRKKSIEKRKQYRIDNLERIKKYNKQWVLDNPEKVRRYQRKSNIKHKEKIKEYKKQYCANNREKINKAQRMRRAKSPEKRWVNNYPLGYHHTDEARRKIGEASKGNKYMLGKRHSLEARMKISEAEKGKMPKNLNYPNIKFGNVKRGYYDINGESIFFRSKWEANYALYLDFLVEKKQIRRWSYEEDVFIFEKIKFGTRSYRPDFKIYNFDKTIIYHEVKGYMDSKSKTKIKRMAKYYADIKLIIIDAPVYKDLKKKLGKLLKFY